MANRRHTTRHVKRRRLYDVRSAAKVLGATPGTIRHWLRNGLTALPGIKPTAFRGVDIIDFFERREATRKHASGPGRIYCLKCREPKAPAGGMVDYRPTSPKRGTLIGICPDCHRLMYRACSPMKLEAAARGLTVSIQNAESSLIETPEPILNPTLSKGSLNHEKVLPRKRTQEGRICRLDGEGARQATGNGRRHPEGDRAV